MGVVYKARDRETGAMVAVKLIHPSVGTQPGVIDRFKAELLLARRITHKNVCRVYDLFRFGDVFVIAMEFVDGERLRDVIARQHRLAVAETLAIVRQLIAALREAHVQGIVHRDIKPENVQIGRDGIVRLMDFGLARSADSAHTSAGMVMGTPAYMAPEQAEGRAADGRTDIYALGLVIYEMLTGKAAFRGDSAITVALKQVREAPPPPASIEPTISGPVEQVILRALEKDPAKRFQTVDELEDALVRAAGAGPLILRPFDELRVAPSKVEGRQAQDERVRRTRRWQLAAAVAVVIAAGAAAGLLLLRRPASIDIPFQRFTLDNGLRVLISEDHSAPTFSICVTYNVGSRDERPGKTGIGHLFEHLMFGGSLNVGKGEHFLLVMNNGGYAAGLILGNGLSSRLYQKLVRETEVAVTWSTAIRCCAGRRC